jgi:3-deoxy-7-phosphoheptulonate synthase
METTDLINIPEELIQDLPAYQAREVPLVDKRAPQDSTIVSVKGVEIGGEKVVVMAGPCAVEGMDQIVSTAKHVQTAGATILRGGAYKPRTSPYSFQGLGVQGLKMLAESRNQTGMPVVTEIVDPEMIDVVSSYADMLQIGARNMQNFALLKAAGKSNKPVLLKRGLMSTIQELLNAAEYILAEGNENVVLCERGIRTFETHTRNTLDISAVPILKQLTHLPVIVDPSHATGLRDIILPVSRAAIAAGADGIIVEVHPNPDIALSDGPQSLDFKGFNELINGITPIVEAMGRNL